MLSDSYRDIKRYLQLCGNLGDVTQDYLCIKDSSNVIIPHPSKSLFADQLPVDAKVLKDIDDPAVIYGVTHFDGNIYIQFIKNLKPFLNTEITSGVYLVPVEKFSHISSVYKIQEEHTFVHIHRHSMESALDGMAKHEDAARRCKQIGMKSLGLTDHGTLAGTVGHYKSCKKYGIHPVLGQEFYLDDDHLLKGVPADIKKDLKKDKTLIKAYEQEHRINLRRHICLYAMNEVGLKNLYRLSSLGYTEGFYYRPRIDWGLLRKYNEGIICSTACAAGILCAETKLEFLKRNIKWLLEIFGRNRLYLETMLIEYEPQRKLNDIIFKISEKLKLPVICGVDSHYVDPDPNKIHQYYMKIGSGYSYEAGDNYLKTYSEMKEQFDSYFSDCKYGWEFYHHALMETNKLAEKCQVEIELGKFKMPEFDLSRAIVPVLENETHVGYLKRRAIQGFKNKIVGNVDDLEKYKERFKYELKTFIDAGYVNYMLIVQDMIDYAKSKGWIVVVRGSAAGSLMCYCIGMTSVDPIKLDLLFERFVSPLRAGLVDKSYQSPPDVDADYPNRDEIIQYAMDKYGKDCVARIRTANRNQVKQAIKSMAEATGFMDFKQANIVTKMIPDSSKDLEEAINLSLSFGEWYEKPKNKEWIDNYVEPILGIVGHDSIHAAGIVIAPGRIMDYVPVKAQEKKKEDEKSQDKERVILTQFEGDSVEEIGLLKFDILRVRTLAHLKRTIDLIEQRHNRKINLEKINLDNPAYYKGFQKKDTQGIFQLDTKSTSNLLNHTTIENFDDVIAVISLSRPGTAGPGLDMEYCERKKGKPFEYDHPLLEPILKNTYGIPIYQEQIMKIVNQVGGLSLVEADKFRKMIKKKNLTEMASYREKFIKGAKANKIPRVEALKIWEKVISWSSYGFTRAHAAAYAQVSVWTMVLKQLFPLEFYIGWLDNPKDKHQLINIYRDIRAHNIPIVFPNVNKSKTDFYISDNNEIVWALKGIKYVGEKVAQSIAENAPYENMKELIEKNKGSRLTKRAVDPLICLDAFPWCDGPAQAAGEYYRVRGEQVPAIFQMQDERYWNRLFYENIGFHKKDPLEVYSRELSALGTLDTLEEFMDLSSGETAKIAGYITDCRFIDSKRGPMAILDMEYDFETIKIVMWSSFFKTSDLSKMEKNDIVGKFVFVFGDRDINDRGGDQILLGNPEQDKFMVIA